MALHPADALAHATTWTSRTRYKAREQARREALQRDRHRYDRPKPPPTI